MVSTRLILKEEIRITRRTHTEVVRELVQLRSEQAEISRLEGRDAADLPNPDQRSPSMTERTLTAMYDTRGLAESARDQLVGIGVAPDAITIHGGEDDTGYERPRERGQGLLGQPRRFVHAGRRSSHLHRGRQAAAAIC